MKSWILLTLVAAGDVGHAAPFYRMSWTEDFDGVRVHKTLLRDGPPGPCVGALDLSRDRGDQFLERLERSLELLRTGPVVYRRDARGRVIEIGDEHGEGGSLAFHRDERDQVTAILISRSPAFPPIGIQSPYKLKRLMILAAEVVNDPRSRETDRPLDLFEEPTMVF